MFIFSPHGDSGPSVLHLHPSLEPHSMFTPSQYMRNGTWRGSLHWLGGELSLVFLLTFYWSELVPQSLLTSKQAEKCSLDVCPGKRGQNFEQPKDFATVFPPLHHTSICTCLPTLRNTSIHLPKATTKSPIQLLHQAPIPESLVMNYFIHLAQFLTSGLKVQNFKNKFSVLLSLLHPKDKNGARA